MKFAINLPNVGSPHRLVEIASRADANGWDAVFLWDHIHLERQMHLESHDPWVLLGAIARETNTVKLGTMITALPRRRPQKFAKEVVTLDHLSGGRVIVGVGLGFPPEDEFTMFGENADDHERAGRLDEALDVVTALWTAEPLEHRGRYYEVSAHLHPPCVQRPRPPIWVAGTVGRLGPVRRARRFEGYFPMGESGPSTLDELALAREQVGPDITLVGSWMPGASVDDYAAAGVDWLVDSRWPDGDWMDELDAAASAPPQ